jgi:hypothetical protein
VKSKSVATPAPVKKQRIYKNPHPLPVLNGGVVPQLVRINAVANYLGIGRETVKLMLKQYGIDLVARSRGENGGTAYYITQDAFRRLQEQIGAVNAAS